MVTCGLRREDFGRDLVQWASRRTAEQYGGKNEGKGAIQPERLAAVCRMNGTDQAVVRGSE